MPLFQSSVWCWGRFLLLIFLAIRLIFWGVTFPNPDEAYYWLWGQHPAFSYYDHPPFQAWVQGTFTALLGRSHWVLRFPNLLSNLVLAVFYYRICRYLYGQETADRFWLVVMLLASSPLFFLFLGYAWHDHWLVTFSVVSSFWFVRFVDAYRQTGKGTSLYLYGSAVTLGLAGLCKYNAVFVGLGFLATILSNSKLRSLGGDRRFYLACLLLALTLAPILIWNWQHDFYSFRFYADRSAGSGGFSINPLQPVAFLALCALILGPIQAWSVWRFLRQSVPQRLQSPSGTPFSGDHPSTSIYYSLAIWIFILSTVTFTVLSLISVAVYYWNILAYPLLFPPLTERFYSAPASALNPPTKASPLRRPRQFAFAQGLGLFAAAALVFHYTVLPFTAFLGGKVDPDSAALFGWPQVGTAVEEIAADLVDPLLLTTDYRSASALAYVLNDPEVMAISGRIDQFDFWYDSQTMNGRNALLLGETWHPICPGHLDMFASTTPAITIPVRRFGVELQTYQVVKAYGFEAGPEKFPLWPNYPLAFSPDGEQCNSHYP